MKKFIKTQLFAAMMLTAAMLRAQTNTFPSTGAAGIGTTAPNASALLDVTSTSKGILVPRMTKNQRDAIVSPATGLLIFQTNSTPGFYYFNGTSWTAISSRGANTSLSNLVSTAINQPLLPNADRVFSLGSALRRWDTGFVNKLSFGDGTVQGSAFVPYTAGTGISIASGTISNTAPDQTVVLNAGSGISIGGAYPNFTIGATNASQWTTWVSGINYLGGNVGIGVSTPGNKLEVSGDILVNNIRLGRGAGNVITNTAVGYLALNSVSISNGGDNTGVGNRALSSTVSGLNNTALGSNALYLNVNGSENVAVGHSSLSNNTGSQNTAVGNDAMFSNTTGAQNTSLGGMSMFSNTSGTNNVAIGYNSLYSNTTGANNTGTGYNSLYKNSTGGYNTANGYQSMANNTTGIFNAAYGGNSLNGNSTGNFNTALGYGSLFVSNGNSNVANGYEALFKNTSGSSNTANGYLALFSNTTGNNNTANGASALYSNSTGTGNTANGLSALYSNTSGNDNTASGNQALYSNTTGTGNTADGTQALYSNSTGNNNTASGFQALYSNSSGYSNTAIGIKSMYLNTSGYQNTAAGDSALYNNTTGYQNTTNGYQALYANTSGYENAATGYQAMSANSTGFYNVASGSYSLYANTSGYANAAFGSRSLLSNTTGTENTAVGYFSLANTTTGNKNTATGSVALYSNTTGLLNAAFGDSALISNTTGSGNTAIGAKANVTAGGISNATAIGYNATVDVSNKVRIGNTNVTSIGGQVGWTIYSDARIKKDIKQNVPGLTFIRLLKPATYHYDLEKENNLLGVKGEDKGRNADFEKITFTGFLAQEVDEAAKKVNYDFSGIDKSGKIMGLRYSDFVVPLVKAVQELGKMNDDKDALIEKQDKKIDDLQQQLDDLKALVLGLQQKQEACSPCNAANAASAVTQSHSVVLSNGIMLDQNIPNPFKQNTTISYTLPTQFTNARIVITDKTGKTLKSVNISGSGKGVLNVDGATLSSGAYRYSLIVDDRMVATKQMILAR